MILSTIRSIPADVRTSSSFAAMLVCGHELAPPACDEVSRSITAFSGARLEAQNIDEAKRDPPHFRTMGVNVRIFEP